MRRERNTKRLQELQQQVVWPTVTDLDPRTYIPEVGTHHLLNWHLVLMKTLGIDIKTYCVLFWMVILVFCLKLTDVQGLLKRPFYYHELFLTYIFHLLSSKIIHYMIYFKCYVLRKKPDRNRHSIPLF